ncbi:MAG: prolipoprotein diacylglyceryl transferase [Oscillospiraceae bacterium]|nr:prolipoprotein diacylglyceryl transferase [Oscillospiraceae bacterium]
MNFKFLSDYTAVKFTGIDRVFDIPEYFLKFSIGSFSGQVKFYGLIIMSGFVLAVLFGGRMAWKWKMNINKMLDVLIYGTFFGILGARLYYVVFQWGYYSSNLNEIFKIWEGGLAIYGGLIGGVIGGFLVCKIEKLNFYNLMDLAGMSFLIGQGIGRWGNFTNQEAFGTNTTLPWGMWSEKVAGFFPASYVPAGFDPSAPVHPTFLYESLWCLAGFGILYFICKKYRKFSGQVILCYGIWYGLGRVFIEGLRTDSLYIGSTSIRVSQLLSALIVVASVTLLIMKLRKYIKNPQPIEGIDFFPDVENKETKEKKNKDEILIEEKTKESAAETVNEEKDEPKKPDTETVSDETVEDEDVPE